jgi:hypothetical protein
MCKHFNLINKKDTVSLLSSTAISLCIIQVRRFQRPRGLRRRSAFASLLEIMGSNPTKGMDGCLL